MENLNHLCLGCMEVKGDAQVCPYCGYTSGTPVESPQHLPPGSILHDKYLIGRVLGHGGFGITYLAWDINLDMKLAIKEYMPRDFATRAPEQTGVFVYTGQLESHFEHGLTKFLEEAKTLAQFTNLPGIVGVRDFFRENGTAYLVMYYLEGIDFKRYLELKGGKIPFETALQIMMPVIDALKEVHRTGTLHRDISPDNIYITKEGQVKLLDFGAARHAISECSKSISVILKPGYAPEEQYRTKGKQGPWTDVYATAATLYRAIVGTVPPESLDRLEEDTIKSPSKLGVNIPKQAEEALMKALAVKQTDRLQTIEELQQQLVPFLSDNSEQIEPSNLQSPEINNEHTIQKNHETAKNTNEPEKSDLPVEQKKGVSKWIWVVLGVVAVGFLSLVVGSVVLFSYLASTPDNNEPNKSETNNVVVSDNVETTKVNESANTPPQQIIVPNVLDLTEEDALSILTEAGMQVGKITYVENVIAEKGMVLYQSIEPERNSSKDDVIDLEISKGVDLPVDIETIHSKQISLVNEYWDKATALDKDGDIGGALKHYIQARDMAAEIVLLNGDFDAQYSYGVLSSNIASVKADLGYYSYGLQNAEEGVASLEDLYTKDPLLQDDPSNLVYAYGTLSDLQLFNGLFAESIVSAESGLEIDETKDWIWLLLAHGHLLNGNYEYAEDIYMEMKDISVGELTYKDYIIEAFQELRAAEITHPDMESIELLLYENDDQFEIEVTIYGNALSMEDEDVAGYMSTIDQNSPAYQSTEEFVTKFFDQYENILVEINSIEVLEINGDTAKVRVEQVTTYNDSSGGYELPSTMIHTVIRADGVFKWVISETVVEGE